MVTAPTPKEKKPGNRTSRRNADRRRQKGFVLGKNIIEMLVRCSWESNRELVMKKAKACVNVRQEKRGGLHPSFCEGG